MLASVDHGNDDDNPAFLVRYGVAYNRILP